ncbi:MAG: neutral/alkaline non-lysosomal ceramidase N-terminal domain-containing protein [Myxococcales bacterium]|nr:neutral/alkaline non-lysosomal ceramidase N-terminal domain-containing protein [Myxococcales bacterium]
MMCGIRVWRLVSRWSVVLGALLLIAGGCADDKPTADGPAVVADAGGDAPADAGSDALPPGTPSLVCPGAPSCPKGAGGELLVGTAKVVINPSGCEPYTDTNDDYHHDKDEPYTDLNNNGAFDPCWLAGFGNNQPSNGVNDDLQARVLVLRQDDTTLALVSVDLIGLFFDETEAMRQMLDPSLGIDLLLVGATHNHNGPDTVGIWGRTLGEGGVDPKYMAELRQKIVGAVTAAAKALVPARVIYAETKTVDKNGSTEPYVSDSRDPVVIDPTLTMLRFVAKSDSSTVATLVHWAHHPESWGSKRRMYSADFVRFVRDGVENGVRGRSGVGGTTIYFQGALGGQIGPNRVKPIDADGKPVTEKGEGWARAIGDAVAAFALDALSASTDSDDAPALSFATTKTELTVENVLYHQAFKLGAMKRRVVGYDETKPPGPNNKPRIPTELASIHIGKAHFATVPGELHPEIAIGYDKAHSYSWPQVDPNNKNPPDMSKAPAGPYLKDLMTGRYKMVLGLTPDFVGYIIPRFNFETHFSLPYLLEAEGDHYEETNSIGPDTDADLSAALSGLFKQGL